MQKVNQAEFDRWKANNQDSFGTAIFTYAERWADMIEAAMEQGQALEDVAMDLSHKANEERITGWMYGAAIRILHTTWIHGERLVKWHNKSYGVEDTDIVVNPAILYLPESDTNE